jgi:hypothetical protein
MDYTITIGEALGAYTAVEKALSKAWSATAPRKRALEALADASGTARAAVRAAYDWASGRGLAAPSLVINGRVKSGTLDLQQDLMPLVSEEMQLFQKLVMNQKLDDSASPSVLHALLGAAERTSAAQMRASAKAARSGDPADVAAAASALQLPGTGLVVPCYHAAIFAAESEQRFLPLSAPQAAPLLAATDYVHAPATVDEVKPVSLTIVDDFSTQPALTTLASALSFIRAAPMPASASGGESEPPAPDAATHLLSAPARLRSTLGNAIRVGMVHVPTLTAGDAEASTVGDLVATVWSLVASSQFPAVVQVRPDDQAPLLAGLVDVALGVLTRDPTATAKAVANAWISYLAKAEGLPVKQRIAEKVSSAIQAVISTSSSVPITSLLARRLEVADIARRLLPDALPETRSVSLDAGGGMAVRGIAANGRLLAVAPAPPGGVCAVGAGGSTVSLASRDPASTGSASALPACVGPMHLGVLALHEKTHRGASVAALLQTCSFNTASSTGDDSAVAEPDPDSLTAEWMSGVVMTAASAVGASLSVASGNAGGRASGRQALRTYMLQTDHTMFVSAPKSGSAAGGGKASASVGLYVTAIVDPASEEAQRMAPLLMMLRDRLGATVKVHLAPTMELTEMPLKSYYRYVLPAELGGSGATATSPDAWRKPAAAFAWLPGPTVLTAKLYVPEPWNVQTSRVIPEVDLDNLRLADVPQVCAPDCSLCYVLFARVILAGPRPSRVRAERRACSWPVCRPDGSRLP